MATDPKTSNSAKTGTALTIASGVVLAVPLLYVLYGKLAGNVMLNTSDDINRLFTFGIILTGLAGVLGLVAAVLHGIAKRFVSTGISAVVLLVALAFLFTTVLPRTQALQHLNDKIAPFGHSLQANCQTPLDATTALLKAAQFDAVLHATDDAGFVTQMKADISALQDNSATLTKGLNNLNLLSAPDSKYQALLDGCKKDVKGEIDLLNNTSSIPFPPAVAQLTGLQSESAIKLLQDAAAVASGQIPLQVPPGSAEQLVGQTLKAVLDAAKDPQLTAEGNQLQQDIVDTLNNNLAPFKWNPALAQ